MLPVLIGQSSNAYGIIYEIFALVRAKFKASQSTTGAKTAPEACSQLPNWRATPTTQPTVVIQQGSHGDCNIGCVSWNGATEVTSYDVYEGTSHGSLCKVGSVKKAGFETKFGVSQKCVQVRAVEGDKEVSRSEVACSAELEART